jgi:hypothetical protein
VNEDLKIGRSFKYSDWSFGFVFESILNRRSDLSKPEVNATEELGWN